VPRNKAPDTLKPKQFVDLSTGPEVDSARRREATPLVARQTNEAQ
jgi:hypothetical protein